MKNNSKSKLSSLKMQSTALPDEVTPENAFTKMTVFALRAADKYKLKKLKLRAD